MTSDQAVLRATGHRIEKNTKVDYAQLHSYSLTYLLRRRVTIPDVVEPRPFLSFTTNLTHTSSRPQKTQQKTKDQTTHHHTSHITQKRKRKITSHHSSRVTSHESKKYNM